MKKFLLAVAVVLASILPAQAFQNWYRGPADYVTPNGGGISIGNYLNSYYTGNQRHINWWKSGNPPQIVSSINGTVEGANAWNAVGNSNTAYFDTNGELNCPAQSDISELKRTPIISYMSGSSTPGAVLGPGGTPGTSFLQGAVFTITWDGSTQAPTLIDPGGSGNNVISGASAGVRTLTLSSTLADILNLGLTFPVSGSDCPTNIKIYQAVYSSNVIANEIVNPAYKSAVQYFGIVRFMQEQGTQRTAIQDFESLADLNWSVGMGQVISYQEFSTDAGGSLLARTHPYPTPRSFGPKGNIAPDVVCKVSRELRAHGWWIIPPGFTDAATTSAANSFKACMPNGLIAHFEPGNEPWNTGADYSTYRYFVRQPWPPIGASSPYQQERTISSITPSTSPTTINTVAAHGLSTLRTSFNLPEYGSYLSIASITPGSPTTITTTAPHGLSTGHVVELRVSKGSSINALNGGRAVIVTGASTFTVAINTTGLTFTSGDYRQRLMGYLLNYTIQVANNVDSDTFTINLDTSAYPAVASGYAFTTTTNSSAMSPYGYRLAQMAALINTAYGPSNRARWKAHIGSQSVDVAVTTGALTGAMFYLNNEATAGTKLSDIIDYVSLAPYIGNQVYNGNIVTNITKAASGVAAITYTCSGSGQTCPTTGSQIRIYAATGMTQIHNMTATITCSPCTTTGTINIDTTAFSTWATATGNFMMMNTIPKMVDDAITLNGSTPGTYPTYLSYFTQEMVDSILNGTATASGLVTAGSFNLRPMASCATSCLPAFTRAQQLIANSYGLGVSEYEAWTGTYLDTNGAYITTVTALYNALSNWYYDAGTATYSMSDLADAMLANSHAAGVSFPSFYVDRNEGDIGGFTKSRYWGTTAGGVTTFDNNAVWSAVSTLSQLGPYTPTVPTAPGTYSYPCGASACYNNTNISGVNLVSASISPATGMLIVGVTKTAQTVGPAVWNPLSNFFATFTTGTANMTTSTSNPAGLVIGQVITSVAGTTAEQAEIVGRTVNSGSGTAWVLSGSNFTGTFSTRGTVTGGEALAVQAISSDSFSRIFAGPITGASSKTFVVPTSGFSFTGAQMQAALATGLNSNTVETVGTLNSSSCQIDYTQGALLFAQTYNNQLAASDFNTTSGGPSAGNLGYRAGETPATPIFVATPIGTSLGTSAVVKLPFSNPKVLAVAANGNQQNTVCVSVR